MACGKSAVWSPDGELLACANNNQECAVMAIGDERGWQGQIVPLDPA